MRILFIPIYFFYKLLPLIVISLCVYESCYCPDLDRIKFDKYKDEAILLSRAGVPASILIFREINNEVGVDYLLEHYPHLRFKDEEKWIKVMGLNKKQAIQILTFKAWLKHF
jgi:hypothetical protein